MRHSLLKKLRFQSRGGSSVEVVGVASVDSPLGRPRQEEIWQQFLKKQSSQFHISELIEILASAGMSCVAVGCCVATFALLLYELCFIILFARRYLSSKLTLKWREILNKKQQLASDTQRGGFLYSVVGIECDRAIKVAQSLSTGLVMTRCQKREGRNLKINTRLLIYNKLCNFWVWVMSFVTSADAFSPS